MDRQPGPHEQMNVKKRDWVQKNLVFSSNNCDCSGTCWNAYCCSCCLWQRNYNRYKYLAENDQDVDINSKCGGLCLIQCCFSTFGAGYTHWILPWYSRGKVSKHRRINENPVFSCLASYCCSPCSLIQEAHELEHELEENGEGKKRRRNQRS